MKTDDLRWDKCCNPSRLSYPEHFFGGNRKAGEDRHRQRWMAVQGLTRVWSSGEDNDWGHLHVDMRPGVRSGHQWGLITGHSLSGHWQPQPPPSHSLLSPASLSPVSTAELWLVSHAELLCVMCRYVSMEMSGASVGNSWVINTKLECWILLSRFRWFLDDAGSFVATLRHRAATGWSGMVEGRAVMRKLGPEPRNQGGRRRTILSFLIGQDVTILTPDWLWTRQ